MMYPDKICVSAATLLLVLSTLGFSQETPWQDIGPYMGYINAMAMDEAHPDTLYAATPYGVYRSFDCAGNWVRTGLAGVEINAVQVAQTEPGTLIASSDSVVYKSGDSGETWKEIWKSERTVGAIAFGAAGARDIWVGVHVWEYKVYEENLYHSVDGGEQWTPVAFKAGEELKLGQVLDIHMDRSDTSVIYVAGWNDTYHVDGGLFVSQDGGKSWTNFKLGGCSTNNGISVTTTPAGYEPHATYVLVKACDLEKQLFKSLDSGKSWEELWTPFDLLEGRQTGEIIRVDRLNPKWILVGGIDTANPSSVFCYNGEENKWYYWVGSPHYRPKAILSHPDGNFLGFKNNGVYQNPEGGPDWEQKNRGMADVYVLDILNYPGDPDKLLVAVTGNLATTLDGGAHWSVDANSFTRLAVHEQDTGIIFGGKNIRNNTFMSPFNYYKSLNGGAGWISKKLFTNSGMLDYYYTLWVGDILLFPGDPGRILIGVDGGGACGEGLYLSTDGGGSWDHVFTTGVSALALDPVDHNIVYLGTSGLGYVFRSEDGGSQWTRISPGGNGAFVNSVRDLGVDKDHQIYAATSAGLYSWDGGESWTAVAGMPEVNTPAIAIDNRPATPVVYAGTETQGMFSSGDGGSTWEAFNNGLEQLHITRLKLNDANPRGLYAGTQSGGVWMTTLPELAAGLPVAGGLGTSLTVYPNPSQGSFRILTGGGDIQGSLQLMNLLGEVVHAEQDVTVPAQNGIEINPGALSPGCYILILNTGRETLTRKVMVE